MLPPSGETAYFERWNRIQLTLSKLRKNFPSAESASKYFGNLQNGNPKDFMYDRAALNRELKRIEERGGDHTSYEVFLCEIDFLYRRYWQDAVVQALTQSEELLSRYENLRKLSRIKDSESYSNLHSEEKLKKEILTLPDIANDLPLNNNGSLDGFDEWISIENSISGHLSTIRHEAEKILKSIELVEEFEDAHTKEKIQQVKKAGGSLTRFLIRVILGGAT